MFGLGEGLALLVAVLAGVLVLVLVPVELLFPGLALLVLSLEGLELVTAFDLALLKLGDDRFGVGPIAVDAGLVLALGGDRFELFFDDRNLGFEGFGLVAGFFGQNIVVLQFQQIGEDLFAFAGAFEHEFVGAALAEVGGVDEGFVVEVDLVEDELLGDAEVLPGEGAEAAFGGGDLEVEGHGLAAIAGADDAIGLAVDGEAEVNAGFALALVNDVVFGGGAAVAPDGPGDGFEQGGFACAVGSTDAGCVQPPEVEGCGLITQEVTQREL